MTLQSIRTRLPGNRILKALVAVCGGKGLAVRKRMRHSNRPLTEAQTRILLNVIDRS